MDSINPSLEPNTGDNSQVDPFSKTLQTQLSINNYNPQISIFEVPKTRKAEKLESYVPRRIGLGPNHHFHPKLYEKMQQDKLNAAKRVLKPLPDSQEQAVIKKVKEIISVVSACYGLNPDRDNDKLKWLFAIDGLFLLHLLDAHSNQGQAIEAKDLFMLENQIPLILLQEIQKTLLVDNAHSREAHLEFMFHNICKSHSPFHISKVEVGFDQVNHILDYMYRSIIQNKKLISNEIVIESPGRSSPQKNPLQELIEAIMKAVEKIPLAEQYVNVVNKVLNTIFERMNKKLPMADEIDVPSVSELHNIAKVKFLLSEENERIEKIKFLPKERVCYLPRITLNYNTEVILRNLMAYENLMATNSFMSGFGLELTEYVDLMCGIIDTADDVRLLRKEKIIEGDLEDEDIVKMFNGIGRSLAKMSVTSDLRKCVAELNKVYESMPIVRAKKMADNLMRGAAKAITFLVSISSTLILVHQVYSKAFPSNPPHMMIIHFLSELVKKCLFLIK